MCVCVCACLHSKAVIMWRISSSLLFTTFKNHWPRREEAAAPGELTDLNMDTEHTQAGGRLSLQVLFLLVYSDNNNDGIKEKSP